MKNFSSMIFIIFALFLADNCFTQQLENGQRDLVSIVCNGSVEELKRVLPIKKDLRIIDDRVVQEKEYALYSAILLKKTEMAKVLLGDGVRPQSFSFRLSDLKSDIKNMNAVHLFRYELEVEKRNKEDGTEGDCASGDPNSFFYDIHTPDILEAILKSNHDYCTLVNFCGEKITQIITQDFREKSEKQALIKAYRAACRPNN